MFFVIVDNYFLIFLYFLNQVKILNKIKTNKKIVYLTILKNLHKRDFFKNQTHFLYVFNHFLFKEKSGNKHFAFLLSNLRLPIY